MCKFRHHWLRDPRCDTFRPRFAWDSNRGPGEHPTRRSQTSLQGPERAVAVAVTECGQRWVKSLPKDPPNRPGQR